MERDPEVDRRHPTSNLKISPSEVSSMRKTFLSTVRSVEQLLTGRNESEKHLRSDHFKSYKSLFAKGCLLQRRDHPRSGRSGNIDRTDFYQTCVEKNKHVGIFTPGCLFPHMFGFYHIYAGKSTHVWKNPHNYMLANVGHFPHMCGKSQ